MNNVVNYNPDSVLSVFDNWDRMLGDFFGREGSASSTASIGYPSVDIREEEDHYVLEAELPGLSEKDVAIKVNDRVLSIASIKEEEKKEEAQGVWLIRERDVRTFRRSFTLPRDVDTDRIHAAFKDGLLTVTIDKRPESKEKSIDIKHG